MKDLCLLLGFLTVIALYLCFFDDTLISQFILQVFFFPLTRTVREDPLSKVSH